MDTAAAVTDLSFEITMKKSSFTALVCLSDFTLTNRTISFPWLVDADCPCKLCPQTWRQVHSKGPPRIRAYQTEVDRVSKRVLHEEFRTCFTCRRLEEVCSQPPHQTRRPREISIGWTFRFQCITSRKKKKGTHFVSNLSAFGLQHLYLEDAFSFLKLSGHYFCYLRWWTNQTHLWRELQCYC